MQGQASCLSSACRMLNPSIWFALSPSLFRLPRFVFLILIIPHHPSLGLQAAVAPIAEPGTLRLSGMEFCPKTRSAVFLQDEDGLRSLPWPEGDLEGWEGFPEGIAGTVGAEQEFRYQHVRRDPYLHHLLGLQSRRVKGDEHRGAHLVLQKCPPDVNPGFALVSDDAADSITTVSLDRKVCRTLDSLFLSSCCLLL